MQWDKLQQDAGLKTPLSTGSEVRMRIHNTWLKIHNRFNDGPNADKGDARPLDGSTSYNQIHMHYKRGKPVFEDGKFVDLHE